MRRSIDHCLPLTAGAQKFAELSSSLADANPIHSRGVARPVRKDKLATCLGRRPGACSERRAGEHWRPYAWNVAVRNST